MNHNVFERERPLAHTKFGTLRGVAYGDVNIFMGVAYARAKRFQMPAEIEPWEGVQNAYHHGPIAMQAMETNPFAYYRGLHMLEKQSEDCQNLNIWAPKTLNGEKKAVFVFIHGGGFFAGNAFEEISFDGFNMAHNSDVIFVSINHRLNILGHLNLEEYGAKFWNSANAGIADLAAALKWIHENIAAFGGDPENVTICGHSGGGGKVQCLFMLEEAAPYFQKGMVMSGARAGSLYPANDRESSRRIARDTMNELGITRESIEKIYDVPFAELARAARRVATPFGWAPVANDYFPGFSVEAGLPEFSKEKPVIYSSTLGEFPAVSIPAEEKLAITEADQIAYLENLLGEHASRMIELFRKAYPEHQVLDLAFIDTGRRYAAVASALEHEKKGCKNAYLMMCSYCVPEDGWLPVWHGGEMAYIFQNEDKVLALNEAVHGVRYAKIFRALTTNFVKYGDPNNKYLPKWEPVQNGENNTMIVDLNCRTVAHHDDELIDLFEKYGPKFTVKLSHS